MHIHDHYMSVRIEKGLEVSVLSFLRPTANTSCGSCPEAEDPPRVKYGVGNDYLVKGCNNLVVATGVLIFLVDG